MQNVTFDFLGQHRHGTAFHEYLRLRKAFFVDALGWDIPHNDEVEMDQYDNPCAYYSLVVRRGKVVGGCRTMPTTASWGRHTYMLRDALRGCIDQIPTGVIPVDVATNEVWECTRLVMANSVAQPFRAGRVSVDGHRKAWSTSPAATADASWFRSRVCRSCGRCGNSASRQAGWASST